MDIFLIFYLVFYNMNLLITWQFLKLNKTRFKCKQNILLIANNINNTNNVKKLMKELNETNWTFIKSEDSNISLDIFITHFSKIYNKTLKNIDVKICVAKKIFLGLQKV